MMITAKLLGYLLLGIVSVSVLAEENSYQVELIVFSQDFPNTELFEQTTSKIDWPTGITEVSDQQRATNTTLDESLSLLSKAPNYRVIKYLAWVQKVELGGVAAPVRIRNTDGQLNGFLQLHQSPLHVVVDVEYPAERTDNSGNIVLYRLHEKRPVQLDDIYYLDHPRIGALVKVTAH